MSDPLKPDPFGNEDFSSDAEIVVSDEMNESCFELLEAGVTLKTIDDRGQEVQIQFEASSENEEDQNDADIFPSATHEFVIDKTPQDKNKIIDIQKSANDGSLVVVRSEARAINLVYLCPNDNCRNKFQTKEELLAHSRDCTEENAPHIFIEETESNLVISEDEVSFQESLECMSCDYRSSCVDEMQHHVEHVHLEDPLEQRSNLGSIHINDRNKTYRCPKCNTRYLKKFHLVRHLKLNHQGPLYRCIKCSYEAVTPQAYRKHYAKCNPKGNDMYSEASVAKGQTYKCLCTWCEYKSNKYSHVKKHIEIYHESRSHYPCKECVFIGKTVDDYAQHFNSFHKMDEYKHACTDCSFRCTNRTDMRNHYIEVHKKQRLYACKLCMYRAQDVMTIKKHIAKAHSTSLFHCKDCNFSSNKKSDYSRHCAQVHGDSCYRLGGDVLGAQIGHEVQEIVEKVVSSSKQVPDSEVLEEQTFEEQILEEQIEEEIISDFCEGSVLLLS